MRNMWTWTIVDANGNTSEPTNSSRKMVSFTTVSICSTSHFFQNDFKSGKATTYEYPRDNFKCNAFATFEFFAWIGPEKASDDYFDRVPPSIQYFQIPRILLFAMIWTTKAQNKVQGLLG